MMTRNVTVACFLILLGGCSGEPPEVVTTESGLQIIDHTVGAGDKAAKGDTIEVHYTGWFYEDGNRGETFDSSRDRNQPFRFELGVGQVIRGWDEGVQGMRVGGKRELIIPPELGYGPSGSGGKIPPHATLNFEIMLLKVEKEY